MYYDYPEEEFYPESEYQEQIDALKEAIKSSVKSEILEEMNRLRAENEKLQGKDTEKEDDSGGDEKKKDECDRIIRNAEYNAKKMRLSELMKDHKVAKWKVGRELVYGPKCCKCNSNRSIEVRLPSGRIAEDECECKTKSKYYYHPKMYVLSEFTDRYRCGEVIAHYTEEISSHGDDVYYERYACTVCDSSTEEEKKEAIRTLSDKVREILFDQEEKCQEVCDRLNEGLGDFLYMFDGTDVRDYLGKTK